MKLSILKRLVFYQLEFNRRGALGFLVWRFWIFFWSVFRFLCQKTSVFRFWCSIRFADFSFFSIWFLVFVKNTSGFSVLVPNVVLGFSYFFFLYLDLIGFRSLFDCTVMISNSWNASHSYWGPVLYSVFGFGWFCLRFCGFAVLNEFFFCFAVSSIPQCPPPIENHGNAEVSSISSIKFYTSSKGLVTQLIIYWCFMCLRQWYGTTVFPESKDKKCSYFFITNKKIEK